MNLSIISFTENGRKLSGQLLEKLGTEECHLFSKCSDCADESEKKQVRYVESSIEVWAGKQMEQRNALLFIGACGIAVRAVAPNITDKLHDVPVLVMDEKGRYVIPILSGHMGGANELALTIAKRTGAEPVITTATDICGKFAVDLFAKKNGLSIVNKDGIAKVSSRVLAGKNITVALEPGHGQEAIRLPEGMHFVPYPPTHPVDIVITSETSEFDAALLLRKKEYVIGMGCKKGKAAEKIEDFILESMKISGISPLQVAVIASIDLKNREPGLLAWSRKENIPFVTYTAEELKKVEGDFHSSDFVKEKVGVDNVCERAALKACGTRGRLVYEKHAEDGITIAIAKKEWSVTFDET